MKVTKFILEDVRCFKGRHEIDIRPLTFITGGNSTGKSTILACWQVMANLFEKQKSNFNSEPYDMGAFDDIAYRTRPKKEEFIIGYEFNINENISKCILEVRFKKRKGSSEPFPHSVSIELFSKSDSASIIYNITEFSDEYILNRGYEFSRKLSMDKQDGISIEEQKFLNIGLKIFPKKSSMYERIQTLTNRGKEDIAVDRVIIHLISEFGRVISSDSIVPLRTLPKRTYQPKEGNDSAQGDNMPLILRNLSNDKEKWQKVKTKLEKFGKDSGMFSRIGIKKYGNSGSEPFEIEVKPISSPKTSIIDVGFGTSQILPILVRLSYKRKSLFDEGREVILMQQPEVHLHPKGQAALTSFLVEDLKERNTTLIIETHSDFMIDRARIEVKKKNLIPDNIALIFLDFKHNQGATASNIDIDELGNISNTPGEYRDFFTREMHDLLGF